MSNDRVQFRIGEHAGSVREVFTLALPLIIAHLSQSMMWVVDTFLMGRVGNAEQGAVGLGGVLFWAAICFFAGTMTVVNILVAQDFGAGRGDLARHVRTALILVLPMSLIVLALAPLVPEGLGLMRVTEEARPHAETYLQIRLLGAPLMLAGFALTSYLRGIGDTVTPMVVVIAANVFNAVASVILVFGLLGFPAMGVAGAAWGSVAASCLEALLYGVLYLTSKAARAHGSRILSRPSRKDVRDFLSLGTPIGIAWLFEMVAWTAFSIYAGSRPPAELAAPHRPVSGHGVLLHACDGHRHRRVDARGAIPGCEPLGPGQAQRAKRDGVGGGLHGGGRQHARAAARAADARVQPG